MKVVTKVRGRVPPDRRKDLEASYQSTKQVALPPGLESSLLLRSQDGSGEYTIETVWSSMEALQAMRSREKPRAVALFEEVGVSPTVEIHEVAAEVP